MATTGGRTGMAAIGNGVPASRRAVISATVKSNLACLRRGVRSNRPLTGGINGYAAFWLALTAKLFAEL